MIQKENGPLASNNIYMKLYQSVTNDVTLEVSTNRSTCIALPLADM